MVMQIATVISVYANWGFAKIQGICWGDLALQYCLLFPTSPHEVHYPLHLEWKSMEQSPRKQGICMIYSLFLVLEWKSFDE